MERVKADELIGRGVLEIGDGYRAKNSELGGKGLIFLRSAYLQDHGFSLEDPDRFFESSPDAFGRKVSVIDDVVITTKGNSTGRVGRIASEAVGAVYSPHLSYWRSLDPEQINPIYLYYWTRSSEFKSQLFGFAHGTDMAPYLSLRDQLNFRIAVPVPARQAMIAGIPAISTN